MGMSDSNTLCLKKQTNHPVVTETSNKGMYATCILLQSDSKEKWIIKNHQYKNNCKRKLRVPDDSQVL